MTLTSRPRSTFRSIFSSFIWSLLHRVSSPSIVSLFLLHAPVIRGVTPLCGRERLLLRRRGAAGSVRLQTLGPEDAPGLGSTAAVFPEAGEKVQGPVIGRRLQWAVDLDNVNQLRSTPATAGKVARQRRRDIRSSADFVGHKS